jgi:hypothetical protein
MAKSKIQTGVPIPPRASSTYHQSRFRVIPVNELSPGDYYLYEFNKTGPKEREKELKALRGWLAPNVRHRQGLSFITRPVEGGIGVWCQEREKKKKGRRT